jgi:RNA polymerase sigma-70 factor, ECF subfamily
MIHHSSARTSSPAASVVATLGAVPQPPTDAVLVQRAAAGDGDAFGSLVRRHSRLAHQVARRILYEDSDAEDVCQDAFLSAFAHIGECRPEANFRPWLMQIVRHRALDLRRAQQVRETRALGQDLNEIDVPAPARESPAAHAERADLRTMLYKAVISLPRTCRRVLLLHDVHGWRHQDIARRLSCAESTSRAHLVYARRGLRARLGRVLLERGERDSREAA